MMLFKEKTMSRIIKDKLTKTRNLSIPDPKTISEVPTGYEATSGEERIGLVQRVAKNLEAEMVVALQECSALGDKVTQLLGEYAPSGAKAAPLAKELEQIRVALAKTYELLDYLEERKALLLSDGKDYLDAIKKEYEHHEGRKPGLSTTFQSTIKFNNASGDAISEGRANAKKRRTKDSKSQEPKDPKDPKDP
jgi:hypothetical protein